MNVTSTLRPARGALTTSNGRIVLLSTTCVWGGEGSHFTVDFRYGNGLTLGDVIRDTSVTILLNKLQNFLVFKQNVKQTQELFSSNNNAQWSRPFAFAISIPSQRDTTGPGRLSAAGRRRHSPATSSPALPTTATSRPLECRKVEAAHLVPEVRMKIAKQQLALSISEIGRLEIEARRVLVASGPTDPAQALTNQLSAQEQRQLEPWRKRLQQLTVRKNRYMAMEASDLKKRAVDMAKDACLSPTELLILLATTLSGVMTVTRIAVAALNLLPFPSWLRQKWQLRFTKNRNNHFLKMPQQQRLLCSRLPSTTSSVNRTCNVDLVLLTTVTKKFVCCFGQSWKLSDKAKCPASTNRS
jgi:hypothetical protein